MNKIVIIRREFKPEDLFRLEVATNLQYKPEVLAIVNYINWLVFKVFRETFFIKFDLSTGHFYKTIEEVKTAIKQYSKVNYFNLLIRLRRINKMLFVGNRPPTNKNCIRPDK